MVNLRAAKNIQTVCKTLARHLSPSSRLPLTLTSVAASILSTGAHQASSAWAADSSPSDQTQLISTDPVVQDQIDRSLNRAPVDRVAMKQDSRTVGRVYPPPRLRYIETRTTNDGDIRLAERPKFEDRIGGRYAHATSNNNFIFYTLDPDLQDYVRTVVARAQASHVAVVAMDPSTGAILAIAGKSISVPDIEYHAGFPAASLFKVVTAAAAVEHAGIETH